MTYKEKYLAYLFVGVSTLTMSCQNSGSTDVDVQEPAGLLDSTPVRANDFYGTPEILYPTEVKIYDNKQKLFNNKYILTRAPKKQNDWPSRNSEEEATEIVATRYNKSEDYVFVEVYKKDNVLVDNLGLAVIDGNLEVLDPANWQTRADELATKNSIYRKSLNSYNRKKIIEKNNQDTIQTSSDDSVTNIMNQPTNNDSLHIKGDSIPDIKEIIVTDSIKNKMEYN